MRLLVSIGRHLGLAEMFCSILFPAFLVAISANDAQAQAAIRYGQPIGVFSTQEYVRLDIGTRATKENVPASHNSWATRLRISRLDGPNQGPVYDNHLVGIFSEDGRYRLDIGTRATKENVPADHRSWATVLVIQRLDGPSSGEIRYGDLVGFFSEDGRFRLDIGTRAMKENVPASHESWATQFVILRQ